MSSGFLTQFGSAITNWKQSRRARARQHRLTREATLGCDMMEGRALLSSFHFGGGFAAVGQAVQTDNVDSSFSRGRGHHHRHGGAGLVQDEQLATDLQQLRTDSQAILTGSEVTDAERQALKSDLRAISESGFQIDREALATVADSLITALADGTYDSDTTAAQGIQDSFNALFADSTIDQALIDQTFSDFVAVARGLNISSDELATLEADQAAIDADLERLGIDETQIGHHASFSVLDLILPRGRRF